MPFGVTDECSLIESDIHERKATCLGIRSGQSAVGVHSHTIISSDLGYQAQNDIATSRHVSDRDFRPEQGSTEPEHFSSNLWKNDEWRQQSSKGHRTVDQRLAHASGQWPWDPLFTSWERTWEFNSASWQRPRDPESSGSSKYSPRQWKHWFWRD